MEPAPSRRLALTVEAADVVGVVGAICVVVGACVFHWALGLMTVGAGLCGLAWRLSRR